MIKKEKIDQLSKDMHNLHIEMWDELALYGDLRADKTMVIEDYPNTKNYSFACEFVERMRKITGHPYSDCYKVCPITWVLTETKKHTTCENPGSLYLEWENTTDLERKKRKELAIKIRDLNWTNKFNDLTKDQLKK